MSEPVANMDTGTITVYLAAAHHRRRRAPSSALVLGAMQQSSLERNFGILDLRPTGLIALVRDDGALLARVPGSAAHFPRDAAMRGRGRPGPVRAGYRHRHPSPPGILDEE